MLIAKVCVFIDVNRSSSRIGVKSDPNVCQVKLTGAVNPHS